MSLDTAEISVLVDLRNALVVAIENPELPVSISPPDINVTIGDSERIFNIGTPGPRGETGQIATGTVTETNLDSLKDLLFSVLRSVVSNMTPAIPSLGVPQDFDMSSADFNGSKAIFDGRYVYLVPYCGSQTGIVRYDTLGSFSSQESWRLFE